LPDIHETRLHNTAVKHGTEHMNGCAKEQSAKEQMLHNIRQHNEQL